MLQHFENYLDNLLRGVAAGGGVVLDGGDEFVPEGRINGAAKCSKLNIVNERKLFFCAQQSLKYLRQNRKVT